MNYNFLIIGGDRRLTLLAKKLKEDGNQVKTYANECDGIEEIKTKEELNDYDSEVIIASIPLSKDGTNVNTPLSKKRITLDELKKIIENKKFIAGNINQLNGYDILQDEVFTILNTIPTAEGAIQIAMQESDYILDKKKVMVLGFGRVGKILCNRLKGMNLDVYCVARKETDLAWIKAYGYNPIKLTDLKENVCKMDIIFNTIPIKILDKNVLILLGKETLIVDLASYPGGVDYEFAGKMKIKSILALALPGKVAPDTVSEYIKEYIYKILNNVSTK